MTDDGPFRGDQLEAFESVEVDCHCYRCWYEAQPDDMHRIYARMHVCCDCGNKRCPRATDHREDCSGSNNTGQKLGEWERDRLVQSLEVMREHLTDEQVERVEAELKSRSDSR